MDEKILELMNELEKKHLAVKKRDKLIRKIGLEKRILLDIIRDHIDDDVVLEIAKNVCSRSKGENERV